MNKSPDAFRTISEVAEWLGVQAHVLRFWESKFSQVKPVKRAGGRRYYRPADMVLLGGIKKLLHDDGLTIKGVQKILREHGISHDSSHSQSLDAGAADIEEVTIAVVDDAEQNTEIDATILQFKGLRGHAETAADDDAAMDTAPKAATPVEEDKPGSEAAPDPTPDPVTEAETETPVLPSFLHRGPARTSPANTPPEEDGADERAAPRPTPEPVAEATPAARSLVVDAPDPPAETELPYSPGPLAKLARIDGLDAETARQIAPIAAELRTILERATP